VRAMPALAAVAPTLSRREAKPSGVVVLLDRFPAAAVAAFSGIAPEPIARQLALRYLDEWRRVKPLLTGRDLQDLGVPAGPQLQRGLQLIRAARLDGWASERDDERALAMRFAKSIKDSAAATSALELHDD
jgi:tRNA nucleotidyltransferase (CCA-adding enzyme)